jgi:heat-inducible transcriptional repressor
MPRPVTTRQREILTAIVESYIATGEPVSSGTLAQSVFANSMSSATIRNEMAELADAGLLDQPHTSAGRIPSAEAFRLYVAQLTNGATTGNPAASLSRPELPRTALHTQIDTSFAGLAGASALLERTSHVLAALSSGVGLAIGAAASNDLLEHIHFSRLTERRVLAVVVTRSGMVRDRVLALQRDLSSVQLETAANVLNTHFRGWNIERVRSELALRLERERTAYQRLREAQVGEAHAGEAQVALDATDLWSSTIPAGAPQQQAIYIDGVANLIGLSQFPSDRERLRQMLSALEEKQRLIELLSAYVDSRQDSVRVIFDLEKQDPGMAGLVLIAAPAGASGESTVAILGPKRMHYQSAIDAVGYVAQILHRMDTGDSAAPSP